MEEEISISGELEYRKKGIKNFVSKCVTIKKEQNDFLLSERQSFNLSKFVQAKLDEYIKQINDIRISVREEVI